MKFLGDNWATGTGIFETIRVENNQVFALHRHHCRAKEAAEKLGFAIPSEEEVAQESYQVIRSCDYLLGRLRWHFERGGEFTISYVPYEDPKDPAKLMIFKDRMKNHEIKNKEFPYKNLELLEFAKSRGFDDGIIITDDGQIAETSTASLLLKLDGKWLTPPLTSGILNGVVRALVLEAGLAKVSRISEGDLSNIESGLLLTSLRNAQLIGSIAGRDLQLDRGKRDEIHRLMATFKGK